MTLDRKLLRLLSVAAALAGLGWGGAVAQTSGWLDENLQIDEGEVPLPERFNPDRLIVFTLSSGSELRFGVDPDTISLTPDGVVRYVLVARSSGGVNNVLYQGLRCNQGEFRTYAIWQTGQGWRRQDTPGWVVWRNTAVGMPALRLARDAFCDGRMPNAPVSKMVRDLRYGKSIDQR